MRDNLALITQFTVHTQFVMSRLHKVTTDIYLGSEIVPQCKYKHMCEIQYVHTI